jgi:hypothetical protein
MDIEMIVGRKNGHKGDMPVFTTLKLMLLQSILYMHHALDALNASPLDCIVHALWVNGVVHVSHDLTLHKQQEQVDYWSAALGQVAHYTC